MKIYHTATRKDYDALMVELESKGFKWPNGEKPTEQFNYDEYMSGTTVTTYADSGVIRYACVKDDMEISPDEPIIEYKANYCSMCGKKLVEEPEFKVGDYVTYEGVFENKIAKIDSINEDELHGLWYGKEKEGIRQDWWLKGGDTVRHATPEEILEYASALNFHEHGREPFEVKNGDILSDREHNIFFVNEDIEIWNKEDFISGDFTFLKTAEEVNEWLENK